MEYVELVQERLAQHELERQTIAKETELRRLGLTPAPFNPMARFDGLLIRLSKGATERQARRGYDRELVS